MKRLTRRCFIAGASASALASACSGGENTETRESSAENVPGRDAFWSPGPDRNVVKDLVPGPTTIRIGRRFIPVPKESHLVTLEKLHAIGVRAIRLHQRELDLIAGQSLDEFLAACAELDMPVMEFGEYTNFMHPDSSTRTAHIARLTASIETAERLDCPHVTTIAGTRDGSRQYNVHPENWSQIGWRLLVDGIHQVLRDTAGMKAAVGMEAQITTSIDGPDAHRRLMDEVGDPRCAVELDPVNMITLSRYYRTTELINACFDMLGERILSCHAKDTLIIPDSQTLHIQEVCAGRGVLDYETYLVRMSRMKWPRMLRPEHIPSDQYPEADTYLKKIAMKVGVKIHGA